jgi:Ala-tRNA(Pro) deacylase
MLGKDDLLHLLNENHVPFEREEHDAVLNMAESGALAITLEGARCKNLLLQDKSGRLFLVVTTASKSLDLARTSETLGSRRLSFASPDKLYEVLGLRPGSLSPLALINDESGHVCLVIDSALSEEPRFLFHPLDNSSTVALSRAAFDDFLEAIGHTAVWTVLPERVTA